jgi:hypothetical protein
MRNREGVSLVQTRWRWTQSSANPSLQKIPYIRDIYRENGNCSGFLRTCSTENPIPCAFLPVPTKSLCSEEQGINREWLTLRWFRNLEAGLSLGTNTGSNPVGDTRKIRRSAIRALFSLVEDTRSHTSLHSGLELKPDVRTRGRNTVPLSHDGRHLASVSVSRCFPNY